MKVRSCLILFVCLTIFIMSTQGNSHASSSAPKGQEKFLKFYTPLKPTSEGITHFLRHIYNDPEYAQDYLPNDFSHLYQLLHRKHSRSYAQAVLRLIYNKEKSASYINAHAFSLFLEQLPSLIEHYFIIQRPAQEFDRMHKKINSLLYARFLDKFNDFKTNPTIFFDDLSQEIIDELITCHDDSTDISIEELRKTLHIFLEISLAKLIWSPNDPTDTWKSVKKISDQLITLTDINAIINPDDLNDLFITLIERYCYFVDIAATDLPLNFYNTVQKELSDPNLTLLNHPEQEIMIESKAVKLKRSLAIGEARLRALQKGIVT